MALTMILYCTLAFPVDIGRKPASPAHGSRQRLHTPGRASFAGHAYTTSNEAADYTTWRRVTNMGDNPKTINRSDVYIYNDTLCTTMQKTLLSLALPMTLHVTMTHEIELAYVTDIMLNIDTIKRVSCRAARRPLFVSSSLLIKLTAPQWAWSGQSAG